VVRCDRCDHSRGKLDTIKKTFRYGLQPEESRTLNSNLLRTLFSRINPRSQQSGGTAGLLEASRFLINFMLRFGVRCQLAPRARPRAMIGCAAIRIAGFHIAVAPKVVEHDVRLFDIFTQLRPTGGGDVDCNQQHGADQRHLTWGSVRELWAQLNGEPVGLQMS